MYALQSDKYKRVNLKTAKELYNTIGVYACGQLVNPDYNEHLVKFVINNNINFDEVLKKLTKTYGNVWFYTLK